MRQKFHGVFKMRNNIDVSARVSKLSAVKKALLERQLKGTFTEGRKPQVIAQRPPGNSPLSFAQQRLWFLHQLEPSSAAYNLPAALRLKGKLNISAVECSINEIIRRHEILRTTFTMVRDQPVQVVAPELDFSISFVDLNDLPDDIREAEVQWLVEKEAQRPFDLLKVPLLRMCLLYLGEQAGEEDYVLLFTMHHIVSDGWSIGILIREFAILYEAFNSNQSSPLPKLPIQYADFAVWQQQNLQGEMLEQQLTYWKQRLSGAPSLLELPIDQPRPAVQSYRGAIYRFAVSKALTEELYRLSRRARVTLFMVLLAAFKVLLSRYSGHRDICVGTPIANRTRMETEGLIGFFVNTLVLRTDLSGNPRFTELLKQVREVALGAQTHQELPFERLVEELQPVRELSHSPLFQVMFALQNAFMQALELPGLRINQLETSNKSAVFNLTLSVVEVENSLSAFLEYDTDLFAESTIGRMAAHIQVLLEGIVNNPEARLSDLPLLTPQENQQLLIGWNATEALYPRDKCLHQLFEAQVEQTPDGLAVVLEGQSLTYTELNVKANQLAHYLRGLGIGPEISVGLCVERSLQMIIGIFGILKAGGTYVPIDPNYPKERIADLLEDSCAVLLLIQEHLLASLPMSTTKVICLDRDWMTIAEHPIDNLGGLTSPTNLAYVIYTSGSTGRPKGVLVSHRNVVHSTQARYSYYKEPVDCFLLLSSFAFDSSVAGIFWTLSEGGQLCISNDEIHTDPTALAEQIAQERVTHLLCLPSLYNLLLEQPSSQLCSLRVVIVAGDACPPGLVTRHYGCLPGAALFNEYGPTEGTVWSSVYRLPPRDANTSVPIGQPISNMQIYVLDSCLNPVPIGVPGELCIGGVGVARGYLNRPELTAERFIPNPFGEAGSRLYKTGDLAHHRPDGAIEFLGRVDHQVKIRGFRIELGEIEARLLQHSQVEAAVVVAREDMAGDKRVVAYLVGEVSELDVLRVFLRETLPDYMIPSAFVLLDKLPLSPNGKLDRKALPAPDMSQQLAHQYVAPSNPTEKILAKIWAEMLRVEQVGIRDNFFSLGGDSILAIQVVSRARQAGLSLTPRQLFQYQTVAELAAVAGRAPTVQAEQGVVSGEVPLTPIQHWFFEQNLPNPHHWNQAILLEVRTALEPCVVEQAINHLIVRHDVLRQRFIHKDSVWHQIGLADEPHKVFARIDLSAVPQAEQPASIETECSRWQASLHLSEGPLLRVVWFDLGERRNARILVVIHHLVVDGVSWRILVEDLHTACRLLTQGQTVVLPPKTTSFKDWSNHLQGYTQSKSLLQEITYWLDVPGEQTKVLPVDNPGGVNTEALTETVTVSLTEEDTRLMLCGVPAAYRSDTNDILLTALAQTLTSWSRSESILIDLEGHGREQLFEDIDLSRTVGWFTSLFPVLLSLSPGISPNEKLIAVKEQLRRIPRKGIPYGIARYLNQSGYIAEQLPAYPKAQVTFNYLGQLDWISAEDSMFCLAQELSGADHGSQGDRLNELSIDAQVLGKKLRITWSYSRARYCRSTIISLAQAYVESMRELIKSCLTHAIPIEVMQMQHIHRRTDIDLQSEVNLDPNLIRQSKPTGLTLDSNAVLLTGATGFVGAFLLDELLKETQAKVYCLIRSSDPNNAINKLHKNLEQYGIWKPTVEDRIIPICGDLSSPYFGLSAKQFHELANQVDAIYHNGALTNLLQPYLALKPANVLGTKEIIHLACLGRIKPIYYTSTLSVFSEEESPMDKSFTEDDVPDPAGLTMGYAQSKWVAEQLVRAARARGCPVVIYRLGTITGHSCTGAWSTKDFHTRLLKTNIELGKLPELTDMIDMTPVDYVSQSIVYLSQKTESLGQTFHLLNPNSIPTNDFVSLLNSLGYPIELVDYAQWKNEMYEVVGCSPTHVLYPFLPYFEDDRLDADNRFRQIKQRVDCRKTLVALADSEISCPLVDADLLRTYFSYFKALKEL